MVLGQFPELSPLPIPPGTEMQPGLGEMWQLIPRATHFGLRQQAKSRAGSKKGIQEGHREATSPLGIAAKPAVMGIRFSCLPPAHILFAKPTVNPSVPKQAQP